MFVVFFYYFSYRWCEIRPLRVICLIQREKSNIKYEGTDSNQNSLAICAYSVAQTLRLPTSTHIHIYTYKYTHVHAGIHTYTQLYVQVYKYIYLFGNHLIHNYVFMSSFVLSKKWIISTEMTYLIHNLLII